MTKSQLPLSQVDPWLAIQAWPDEMPLKPKEAAVFMRSSESSLQRMRQNGTGPDYFQGGVRRSGDQPAAVGTNQHILYWRADIRAWWEAGKVSSSMMAAIKKGQARRSVFDLNLEEAFYTDADGSIESSVEDQTLQTIVDRLGKWEIIWITPLEAATRPWLQIDLHKAFVEQIKSAMLDFQGKMDAGLEKEALEQAMQADRR